MTFCTFCMKPGHTGLTCWYKPKYIKEIRKDSNGKLKKTYFFSTEAKPQSKLRRRSPSPIQERIQKPKNQQRKECNPEKNKTRNKHPVKEQEIMVIKEIQPGPSNKAQSMSYKCNECIKWEIRLQHCLKENDSLKQLDRINKSLADENDKLREERNAWKKLYETKR